MPPGLIAVGAVPDPAQLLRGPTRVALGLNDEHTRSPPYSLTNALLPTIITFHFLCEGNVFPRLLLNVSPVEDFALPLNQREPLMDYLLADLLIRMFEKVSLSLRAKIIITFFTCKTHHPILSNQPDGFSPSHLCPRHLHQPPSTLTRRTLA